MTCTKGGASLLAPDAKPARPIAQGSLTVLGIRTENNANLPKISHQSSHLFTISREPKFVMFASSA